MAVARLAGGRVLDTRLVRGALNRLVGPPENLVSRARAADRDYAREELFAFWLSWLHALPGPVLNRASPRGLGGAYRPPEEWVLLASAAGLPVDGAALAGSPGPAPPLAGGPPVTPSVVMLVVAGAVVGPVPDPRVRAAVRSLAARTGSGLLGVTLHRVGAGWRFGGATTHPDLRPGGGRVLDLLAAALGPGPGAAGGGS